MKNGWIWDLFESAVGKISLWIRESVQKKENILTGMTEGMGLRQETVGKEQFLGKILRVESRYVKFEMLVDIQVMSSGQLDK